MSRRRFPDIRQTGLDRVIAWLSPEKGVRRLHARTVMAMSGGYTGGARNRRPTQEFNPHTASADDALLPQLDVLRDRSHDLVRNSPVAAGAINTVTTNVVGSGLMVKPVIDRDLLGLTDDAADEWERAARREFLAWADTPDCDLSRVQTFEEQQSLVMRSVLESGDILIIKRYRPRGKSRSGLTLQLIEADRLSNPTGQRDSNKMAGGVEFDADGAPVAYHVRDHHPGDLFKAGGSALGNWTRVPAYAKDGRRRLALHLFDRRRPEQTRGVPYLAGVIEVLKQITDYTDAELQAAVVSSFFTVFVETETGSGMAPVDPRMETGGTATDKDLRLAPGMVVDLASGEKISTANPGRPNDSFDPFVLSLMRQIGMSLELPYEVLIKHFTASYSAARAALLDAWRFYRTKRKWLSRNLCQPVYEEVITDAIAEGRLSAPGFFADERIRKAWLGAEWHGPAQGQIDPEKENRADEIAEDRGWKTAEEITAEKTAGDWETKHRQRVREERLRKEGNVGPNGKQSQPALPAPDPQRRDQDEETEDVA
jgi:lambda family phage portal protein